MSHCKLFSRYGLVLLFVTVLFVTSVSALNANYTLVSPSTGMVERSANNFFNITIGAENANISKIEINITGSINGDRDKFVIDSNSTTATNIVFSNSTYSQDYSQSSFSHTVTLNFQNTSATSIVNNGTIKNFIFNVSAKGIASSLLNMKITTTALDGTVNSTDLVFGFAFGFSAYVKNETGGFQNGTNVTLYEFTQVPNGPPIESVVTSALTNANGAFTLSGINASGGKMYRLALVYYNSTNSATKIGTTLPPFPPEMFYAQSFGGGNEPEFEFMKPPSLNGSTFYLGPAATINITAWNGTSTTGTAQRFGYMVMEQKTGFPIASNMLGNVSNVQVVVPTGKQYTVMVIRANNIFADTAACNGNFMSDTACKTPPKSNSTLVVNTAGQRVDVALDLTINRVYLYGCISASGNSTSITNITTILPKLLPWTGFVPPMRADTQDINLSNTNQLNYGDSRCSGKIAWYNISLLNSPYLVEFYGRNVSAESGAEHAGAFQNVSLSGVSAGTSVQQNITLGALAGSFVASGDVNTTKVKINIQNSTGGAITSDTPHVDLHVRHDSTFGEMTYIIEEFTNGTFYLSIPSGASAKAKIFSNNAPPKEKTLNLSLSETNITLVTMGERDAGFRRINSSGELENINITQDSFGVEMIFWRTGGNCDSISPASTCNLTSTNAKGFNPMTAMLAGSVNMEMRLKDSGVSIIFYNFDMFSAKQPPMETVMNNDGTNLGSAANKVWQFGSFVPADVYDYAIIKIPYSESNINESRDVNLSINNLYDENWNVIWNSTRGDTTKNLTSNLDEYLGNSNNRSFNSTGYRNFLSVGGSNCSTVENGLTGSSPSGYCFMNVTSNFIYLRVPHFSGVAPLVAGTAPSSGSSESGSSSSSSGSGSAGGNTSAFWTTTFVYDDAELSEKAAYTREIQTGNRIRIKIDGASHYVGLVSLTSSSATINVSSTPQQATLSIGEEKKFEVTDDSYYDILVKLNGIANSKANITISSIHEIVVVSPSESQNGNLTGNQTGSGNETDKQNKTVFAIIVTILVILIVGVVIYFIYYMRKNSIKKRIKVRAN